MSAVGAAGRATTPGKAHFIVRLIYPLRVLGCLVTLVMLAGVFYERDPGFWLWFGVLAHGLAWPHLAYALARLSRDQKAAEIRNLLGDAFLIGMWSSLMGFAPLPTLALNAAVLADNLATFGLRLAVKGVVATLAGGLLAGAFAGFHFIPQTSGIADAASGVALYLYVMGIGYYAHVSNLRLMRAKRGLEQKAGELEAARHEAEEASRAKTHLLASTSHELRTPMNAIIGFTERLLQAERAPAQQEQLRHVEMASRSLLGMINQMLDVSRLEAGKLHLDERPFRMRELLGRVERWHRSQAGGKGLAFSLSCTTGLPEWLLGDALRLEQVLMSLLGNAVKFTDHGAVHVQVAVQQQDSDRVTLAFEVRDTGIGIAPELAARLFTPFTQADQSSTRLFGGAGMGLAMSKHLVQLMGGQISVASAAPTGSIFRFTVVMREVAARTGGPAAEGADEAADLAAQLRGARVLVVEDNALNRRLAEAILRDAGIVVVSAENGAQAVAALEQGNYDAVLMDLQMPVMDGLEATRALRRVPALRDLPVIALTANALEQDRAEAAAAGMNDVLAKPIDAEELLHVLAIWIRQLRAPLQRQAEA